MLALLCVLSATVFAQTDQNNRQRRGPGGDNANGGRGNFDPAQMQEQMLSRLREQLDVPDDAEWKLISERLLAVNEIRRAAGGGAGGMRGAPGGPGGPRDAGGRSGRGGPSANPEQDALRQAVADKLPEAEIKSRLARLREARKANEEKLSKAQEDLRALLSVRQEAIAVMYGLLP